MKSTMSLWFVVLVCMLHTILATRLPMEIVEVTSSQQPINSEQKKIGRHKLAAGIGNIAYGLELRKGRQASEAHPARILYQVGVSGLAVVTYIQSLFSLSNFCFMCHFSAIAS